MNQFILNLTCLSFGFISGQAYVSLADSSANTPHASLTPTDYYLKTQFRLVKVVDGDTLDISKDISKHLSEREPVPNTLRVRLHGIDTPERGQFYFAQAAAELDVLCEGQDIRLDTIGDGGFGRVSANVYCGKTFVNAALIQSGSAITSIKYADNADLYKLQNDARLSCKGVWAKPIETAYAPKKLSGRSPVKGKITLTTHKPCTQLTEFAP